MTAEDQERAEPPAPEPPAPAEPPEDKQNEQDESRVEKPAPDWDGNEELRTIRRAFHVHNTFYGAVTADNATFGVGEGERASTVTTGVLDPARVVADLRGFVPPNALTAALRVLTEHRLVVLVGPEGIGKRALAQRLLRLACGRTATLVAASPARSLGQLAAMRFTAGTGYLVADHLGSTDDAAVRGYDADRLATVAKDHDAYLVLTTTSRRLGPRQLPAYAVAVLPPDPVEVLRSHLSDVDSVIEPADLARAEAFVRDEQRPREVARLARKLVGNPADAIAAMVDVPAERVTAWFDRQVTMRELLSIAALAIGGSQPEPTHDVLVRTLRQHIEGAREEREAAPHVPWHQEVLVQRDRKHDLVTISASDELDEDEPGAGWLAGRLVRFRREEYREIVLRELHERYDDQLWHPVRDWVRELCRIDPKEEIQTALAAALAVLARHNFVHIRQTYLAPWAGGSAPERMTAAMVLWFMSDDDRLAPVALRTALDWGENQGLARGVTSALALSGPLGVVFPDEAMARLCFLSLRAKRIGDLARTAMGALFATAAADGAAATGRVLEMVRGELARATGRHDEPADESGESYVTEGLAGDTEDDPDSEHYERGWNGRVARAARSLVLAVLEAEQPDGPDPVAAMILRDQPEHAERLGRLWAEVLCSSPHRADAIDVLRRTLLALEKEPAATDAVARLGSAVWTAMPAAHRPLRTAELVRAMTDAKRGVDRPPHNLVSTLLAALHAATPTPAWS